MEPGWECRKYGNKDGNAENQGEMMGIRVGMMGISVGMWGTGGGNEGNKGENLRIGVE